MVPKPGAEFGFFLEHVLEVAGDEQAVAQVKLTADRRAARRFGVFQTVDQLFELAEALAVAVVFVLDRVGGFRCAQVQRRMDMHFFMRDVRRPQRQQAAQVVDQPVQPAPAEVGAAQTDQHVALGAAQRLMDKAIHVVTTMGVGNGGEGMRMGHDQSPDVYFNDRRFRCGAKSMHPKWFLMPLRPS